MGLFDFVSDIGNKIFDSGSDDAGEKLKDYIEKDNPGVKDLEVEVKGDTAIVKGAADDASALEKVVLMAGNALGISKVEAAELRSSDGGASNDTQYYEIKKGDNLWKIAERYYGNGTKHKLIFEANREVIKDPDKIFPGQKIRIPKE